MGSRVFARILNPTAIDMPIAPVLAGENRTDERGFAHAFI